MLVLHTQHTEELTHVFVLIKALFSGSVNIYLVRVRQVYNIHTSGREGWIQSVTRRTLTSDTDLKFCQDCHAQVQRDQMSGPA